MVTATTLCLVLLLLVRRSSLPSEPRIQTPRPMHANEPTKPPTLFKYTPPFHQEITPPLQTEPPRPTHTNEPVTTSTILKYKSPVHQETTPPLQTEPPRPTHTNKPATNSTILEHKSPVHQETTPSSPTDQQSPPSEPIANRKPKVYDLFTCNDEMDMLEIRLRELEHVVDQFVIVEAEETFKRNPKPLYYYENRARFKKYAHKITHMVLPRMPDVEMQRIRDERILWYGWEVEVFERNTALLTLFEQLKPEEGDWIIISDLDEIPRSSVIRSLTSTTDAGRYYAVETGGEEQQDPDMVVPKDKDLYRLNCNFHEMSFEYKVQFLDVGGPVLLRYRHENSALYNAETDKVAIEKGLKTAGEVYELNRFMDRSWINAGNELRMARNNANLTALNNSCWHCTFCLPNMANVVRKLESFSHHEYNLDEFKTQDHIVFQASHGRDILNRIEDDLIHVPNNKDLPLELRENGDRYQYMLHRFGKFDTGGFLDVTPVPPNLKE